jgi:DNA-binding transcriptional ArsR family regulator
VRKIPSFDADRVIGSYLINYREVPMAVRRSRATREMPGSWRRIIDEQIAKALGNAFRQQILWILNERVASPSEIAADLGIDLRKVCNHIDVLKKAKCIELAHIKLVGNRLQHFYRATSRAFLDDLDWPSVPDSVKLGMRATLLRDILVDAIETVVEGTYDEFDGSHMSWTPMILDEQGRNEMAELLERALREAIAVQESTKERLASSGEAGNSYTVSIMGYPSLGGTKTVGPPTHPQELAISASDQVLSVEEPPRSTKRQKTIGSAGSRKRRSRRKS